MRTTITSVKVPLFKGIALIPLLTVTLFISGERVTAQNASKLIRQQQKMESGLKDAPSSVVEEYGSILAKYDFKSKEGRKTFYAKITPTDKAKLEGLYKRMSKKQQSEQQVGFMPNLPASAEVVPTDKQLTEWENAKLYGVWIDGKKVANTVLRDYSNTDFSHVSTSKLAKNAANYGQYYYQVDLMTKEFYQEYHNARVANKDKTIMFVRMDKETGKGQIK